MPSDVLQLIPLEAFKLITVLFLSFLIGLEREEHKLSKGFAFGGVRTYPLIGLLGYSIAFLSQRQALPIALGLAVIAGFMMLSYWHKMTTAQRVGLTSEMAGLTTYIVGALVYYEHFWIASSLAIASLILLELKSFLETLARRFSETDILNFTKFLFLTIVILPILPDQVLTPFALNPFKTWLVVVAVSAISYGSYLLQRFVQGRRTISLVALLGGAYSSTVTTVALAKRASVDSRHWASYTGGILIASGIMYWRLMVLLRIFNANLAANLSAPFLGLGAMGLVSGLGISLRRPAISDPEVVEAPPPQGNPLELKAAFSFAALFIGITMIAKYVIQYFGNSGVYTLAVIMGVTDVDPFILSLTQTGGHSIPGGVASAAIVIAAASNNLVKGVYALIFGDRQTGRRSLAGLVIFSLLGLLPLLGLL
ncbi:MgtC/SapB family protein [Lyngbya confervoides]|uniref:MgtC/SapB family protein n=1 Tax=Lyngbya confervoides BDU141951 TaxID=1574623 RepID=A0ABD4SZZ3_9CYAN|nr:MgtC/SapB family protein [Lyngbya confervoides]MCM1981935.1 MgtC/SapB family protein [Lyngbya confervoides BDU141951]